ncbi:sodium-dependent phosphate transport protein 2B-like [Branchiostoma lanceolatum]|uniref:sodium-dependent phosphate transport protein 2B-like n=1 Tax=Branchiostoma lanceolatum TaxID=7740 RepID=UPI0034539DF2
MASPTSSAATSAATTPSGSPSSTRRLIKPDTPPPPYSEKSKYEANRLLPVPEGTIAVQVDMDYPTTKAPIDDPWALPELEDTDVKWADLDTCGKVKRVALNSTKIAGLVLTMYLFICSLDFLSSAFRLLGGKAAGKAFSDNVLLQNPVAGLMIGVLATVLVQSSSTSTSIVVTMVASGLLDVRPAIPIIMGANIGTSVTNTIVSMAQASERNEFRRAFGGATVHDMFNWLTVLVFLPIEVATGYLFHLSDYIVKSFNLETKDMKQEFLKVLTKPFTKLVIQIDKKVISKIATGDEEAYEKSLIKEWCEKKHHMVTKNVTQMMNVTVLDNGVNITREMNVTQEMEVEVTENIKKCSFLFQDSGLNDTAVGVILLVVALIMLCVCLVTIVKILNSMLRGRVARIVKKTINAEFPGKLSFLAGYLAILVGAGLTILVQSSSIFTSTMTPLVGIGVISIERMYPLTLGSNIGTTTTGLLAAFANSGAKLENGLQIAICHLFFNLSGIALFYPIPFLRFPIGMAKWLGNTTADYRWFAVMYLVLMFFVFPAFVFGLSAAGWQYLAAVGGPLALLVVVIVVVNVLQHKHPNVLPAKLKNWEWLPLWMHSLQPLDSVITKMLAVFCCCKKDSTEQQVLYFPVEVDVSKFLQKVDSKETVL